MLLHNHPSGGLDPRRRISTVAAHLHDAGVGFGILSNDATELYIVVEVPRERPVVRIDPVRHHRRPWARRARSRHSSAATRTAGASGTWPPHIADGYNDGGVQLLEAGTGVGKSFAYLVPALAWARANGERTVVSTNTINLQEQLVGKDLPLSGRRCDRRLLPRPLPCSKAGGIISAWRGCIRRCRPNGPCWSRTSSTS